MKSNLTRAAAARRFKRTGGILIIALLFFAYLAFGATHLSLTSDEPPHIANGYIALKTGDPWALAEHRHPPLLNALSALPLLLQPESPDPRSLPDWDADFVLFVRALWPQLGPIERLAYVTRYPTLLLAVLLLALVYRWAADWFGAAGGLLAVTALAFDPTLLAHSQLATTDLGVTLCTFAGCYLVARRSRSPQRTQRTQSFFKFLGALSVLRGKFLIWRRFVSFIGIGVLLGLTLAAKGSGVMLLPVVLALLVWQDARGKIQDTRCKMQPISQSANQPSALSPQPSARPLLFPISYFLLLTSAFLTLWATYGFRPESLAAHVQMVKLILQESARTTFLLGEVRQGGWWLYFPVAFAIKTPIPLILALVCVAILALRRPKSWLDTAPLWAFPLFYVAVAIRSGMNIGYRHLLPAFPFAYVAIGRIAKGEWRIAKGVSRLRFHVLRFTFYVLLAWYILGTLRIYPFPIAYFNEVIGGPKNGYRYLVDSNVDWGQSFIALKSWMDKAGVDEVGLSYYTWVDPAVYGVHYRPLPPARGAGPTFAQRFDPPPGVYALSATPLQGVMVADVEMYDWFRHRPPVAQPGYGLLVYEVALHTVTPTWLAQCSVPAAPLTADAIREGLGRSDLREVAFDCTRGWLYPGGGTPGWYALHHDAAHDAFAQRRLHTLTLTYRQRAPGALPPFALYWQEPLSAKPQTSINIGALTYLGMTVFADAYQPGATLDIETWWRVSDVPTRPLSLMLHLAGPGGQPALVGDGLAVPREIWQAGDVLVQRHTLTLPPDAPPGMYTPHIGVYWLDTLERWKTAAGEDVIAIPGIGIGVGR